MTSMSFRIDDKLRDEFSMICKERNIMGSVMIRGWMEEYVKANKGEYTKDTTHSSQDRISAKMPKELRTMFENICSKNHLNMSGVLRELIEQYCEEHK